MSGEHGQVEPLPDIMTAQEAAGFLRVHMATLRRLTQSGAIPARKVGAQWRYSRAALYEWLTDGNNPNSPES